MQQIFKFEEMEVLEQNEKVFRTLKWTLEYRYLNKVLE